MARSAAVCLNFPLAYAFAIRVDFAVGAPVDRGAGEDHVDRFAMRQPASGARFAAAFACNSPLHRRLESLDPSGDWPCKSLSARWFRWTR
jgi:hypothetical protein